MLASCTDKEWERYGLMRESKIDDAATKALMSKVSEVPPAQIPGTMLLAMKGVAKIFVGEVIDKARLIRHEWGGTEDAPLQPRHIRESYRRLHAEGKVPGMQAQAERAIRAPKFRR
mmetsp:Transcript_35260/g.55083  ORF Transcript_35260/g.55083 Transcript_35260/m.55083 type:complete len:116 (+) Transcript_35260:879-1226(+)